MEIQQSTALIAGQKIVRHTNKDSNIDRNINIDAKKWKMKIQQSNALIVRTSEVQRQKYKDEYKQKYKFEKIQKVGKVQWKSDKAIH